MTLLVLPRRTDGLCLYYSGWIAVGEVYQQTGSKPSGTNEIEPVYGWSEAVFGLSGIRGHAWVFVGASLETRYGINTYTIRFLEQVKGTLNEIPIEFVDDNYSYRLREIMFCKCGQKEIDCGECCLSCCSIAEELLKRLS
ncbi:MAG: hypothetical protein RID09_07060 [Coleofasciculus sp. G1-WW12-02]|uniref:hypothetical protein n=1 Tax=Coleofasciculus sp. G1-WW12-02 TaxID=3068483 RepID=UPI0033029627